MELLPLKGALAIESSPILCHSRHAFVTWVVHDPGYIAGALVLGGSLRFHNPGICRICLLSKELVTKNSTYYKDLQNVFNIVVLIDDIIADARHKTWTRFQAFYSSWIHLCFTRLQCLRLGKGLGLEKIIVLDADVVVVGDMSELFHLPTPSGILSFENGHIFSDSSVMDHMALHGTKLSDKYIEESVTTSYGIRGSLMVLSPKEEDFMYFIRVLKRSPTTIENGIGGYGDTLCFIGPDERLFTEHYQKLYGWTHINQKYCMTAWHLDNLKDKEIPKALHFVSKKPWLATGEYFPDFDFWYLEALHLLAIHPHLEKYFNTSMLKHTQGFSSIQSMGLNKFWELRVSRSGNFQKDKTDPHALLDILHHPQSRVILMPSHACYSSKKKEITDINNNYNHEITQGSQTQNEIKQNPLDTVPRNTVTNTINHNSEKSSVEAHIITQSNTRTLSYCDVSDTEPIVPQKRIEMKNSCHLSSSSLTVDDIMLVPNKHFGSEYTLESTSDMKKNCDNDHSITHACIHNNKNSISSEDMASKDNSEEQNSALGPDTAFYENQQTNTFELSAVDLLKCNQEGKTNFNSVLDKTAKSIHERKTYPETQSVAILKKHFKEKKNSIREKNNLEKAKFNPLHESGYNLSRINSSLQTENVILKNQISGTSIGKIAEVDTTNILGGSSNLITTRLAREAFRDLHAPSRLGAKKVNQLSEKEVIAP